MLIEVRYPNTLLISIINKLENEYFAVAFRSYFIDVFQRFSFLIRLWLPLSFPSLLHFASLLPFWSFVVNLLLRCCCCLHEKS